MFIFLFGDRVILGGFIRPAGIGSSVFRGDIKAVFPRLGPAREGGKGMFNFRGGGWGFLRLFFLFQRKKVKGGQKLRVVGQGVGA